MQVELGQTVKLTLYHQDENFAIIHYNGMWHVESPRSEHACIRCEAALFRI